MNGGAILLEQFDLTIGSGLLHECPSSASDNETDGPEAIEEAAQAMIAKKLEELSGNIAQLASQIQEAHVDAISSVSLSVRPALESLLPSLARRGFATELADAVARILSQSGTAEVTLLVSVAEHDQVVEAVKHAPPKSEIAISANQTIDDGTALLRWPHGGAQFDSKTLTDAAARLLNEYIQLPEGSDTRHD